MNTLNLSLRSCLLFISILACCMTACVRDYCDLSFTYMKYTPVYISADKFEQAAKVEAPRELMRPGKIYVEGNLLFISELAKGVHIYDNTDPSTPTPLYFINAPGNYDLSYSCDKLYIDSSTDLLIFDFTNSTQPQLISRIPNALPQMTTYRGYTADPSQGIVIEWIGEAVTEKYNCMEGVPDIWQRNPVPANLATNTNTTENARIVNPVRSGSGGSMSRFASEGDYLYIVTLDQLLVYDASNCSSPSLLREIPLSFWGGEAETIYNFENLLLLGSTNGMYVYNKKNPAEPFMISFFAHANSCDPVIAEGKYAYVTLRNGDTNPCGGFTNQLDLVDISNPAQPWLVRSFPMTNPHGLGLDNDLLFLADGPDGLKVFDASQPEEVGNKLLAHFPNMDGYDVIPMNGTLIFVGDDGIAQYDYTDINDIQLLSKIAINP